MQPLGRRCWRSALALLLLAVSGFTGLAARPVAAQTTHTLREAAATGAKRPPGANQPMDNFLTTCASVQDTVNDETMHINNACFAWNDTNNVETFGTFSQSNCSASDSNAISNTLTSWGYVQIDSGHGYFHCDWKVVYDPLTGGYVLYHEYMDVFYNGSYTHHGTSG